MPSRIPRANQDEQNLPPGNRHKNRNNSNTVKHVDSTKEDLYLLGQQYMTMYVREGNSDRLFVVEKDRLSTVPIQTWRPKKWPKVGLAILLGSRLSIRL